MRSVQPILVRDSVAERYYEHAIASLINDLEWAYYPVVNHHPT